MRRNDLQELARARIKEARILLQARQYSGAYHLSGLAVECALKACIAKQTKRYDFPDMKVVKESWTHDLSKLLSTAGLEHVRKKEAANSPLEQNWALVKDWKAESRYETWGHKEARDLYKAVTAKQHGVLAWIRRHW